ncbi:MAG: hypothetical protein PHO01_01820 [Desulfotomaculaceae bacterium]|nr:hypothetical protein [Desulfotomaculaceae bacterium]
MTNSRFSRMLLVLFALAFLGIQTVSFMTSIAKHEEKMVKLENLRYKMENQGIYYGLELDPVVEIRKEKAGFKSQTTNFIIKVLVILAATVFVYTLMRSGRGIKKE